MSRMSSLRIFSLIVLLWPVSLYAQAKYTAEAEIGKQQFTNSCVLCHGPDGNAISGVDLGHGQYRRATSDADLVRIMRTGIPGTGMPPNNLTPENAKAIVAYLHWMADSAASDTATGGDRNRGKEIFEGKGQCTGCHRVGQNGSRTGPDLSGIGRVRRVVELQRSLIEPDAEVLPNFRFVRAVTRNGETITGRLLNQDTFTVQILDSTEHLRSFSRTDLREFTLANNSPMPSYRDKLTSQELADVVSYLASLKAEVNP
jgi:putative heme-binding domain-containing protein